MTHAGFIHNFNPVLLHLGGVDLYYYGLTYAVGFLGIYLWLRRRRKNLGWEADDVWNFCLLFSVCVLLFGRLFSVAVYHWEYYRAHPEQVFSYWRGGMATHGVLLGGLASIVLFSRLKRMSFWRLADEIVIPAALLLALGRIGNFINGQICGTVTTSWWGVQFPGMEGIRHPVTLYDSAKNLLLIPILLWVRKKQPAGRGMMAGHFVFWYGFLRIFTDLFRDHGALLFGIGRNQYFNALMALSGLALIATLHRTPHPLPVLVQKSSKIRCAGQLPGRGLWIHKLAFILIVLFSLCIRSAWTPEVLWQRRNAQKTVQECPELQHPFLNQERKSK